MPKKLNRVGIFDKCAMNIKWRHREGDQATKCGIKVMNCEKIEEETDDFVLLNKSGLKTMYKELSTLSMTSVGSN